jgi:hypothetical protein
MERAPAARPLARTGGPHGIIAMLRNPWFDASLKAWSLGFEASSVIVLRTLRMAGGGVAAEAEARRMVSEKFEAGLALHALALNGGLGLTFHSAAIRTMEHYARKVRANSRRLSKG